MHGRPNGVPVLISYSRIEERGALAMTSENEEGKLPAMWPEAAKG